MTFTSCQSTLQSYMIGLTYDHTHTLVHAHKNCQCKAVTSLLLELF